MAGPGIKWSDNIDQFAAALTQKNERALGLAQRNMQSSMRDFEAKVTREQLSGRGKGPGGSGLNRISRVLAGSTDVQTRHEEGDFVVSMSIGAPYARTHQGTKEGDTWKPFVIKHPGSSNGFGKGISIPAHDIKMPKRLRVPEDFLVSGTRLIIQGLVKAVKEYSKR